MKTIAAALLVLACSKAKSEPTPSADPAPAPKVGSSVEAPAPAAAPAADEPVAEGGKTGAGGGITVKHQVAEMSGTYDLAFAQVDNNNNTMTIAFVRGCPKLTCDPGPWESEAVAHSCPKAYVATAKFDKLDKGKYKLDVSFAGPMSNVSTATLEGVRIELTSVDTNSKIAGTVSQKTSESSASGSFTAKVCPRT